MLTVFTRISTAALIIFFRASNAVLIPVNTVFAQVTGKKEERSWTCMLYKQSSRPSQQNYVLQEVWRENLGER